MKDTKMDETLKKSIRNGIYAFIIFSLYAFILIISELILEGFNIIDVIYYLIGTLLVGGTFFIPAFIMSLIYYYIKDSRKG